MNPDYRFAPAQNPAGPRPHLQHSIFLILLTGIWGFSAFRYGGIVFQDAHIFLLALGLLGLACRFLYPEAEPLGGWLRWWTYLLPAYVALQLVPLPVALLRVISPVRAEIAESLGVLVPGVRFAPLSIVPPVTAHYFLLISGYCLVFILVRRMAAVSRNYWQVVVPLMVIGVLEAALGVVQSSLGEPAVGTYTNRDHYAGLLEMILPFAIAYPFAIWRRVDTRRRFPLAPAIRICASLAAATVLLVAILGSYSRMGFLAALFAMLVMGTAALAGKTGKQMLLAGMLGAGLIALLVFLPSDQLIRRFAELPSTEGFAAAGRLTLWRESLAVVRAFPVFGCGMGGFESAFLRYKISAPMLADDFVHNDYLQFLIELGAVGFVIGAVLFGAILSRALRAASPDSGPARPLALGCIGAFAAIGLHSLVDFNLYVPANAILLAWICGISTSLERSERRRPPATLGLPTVVDVAAEPPERLSE